MWDLHARDWGSGGIIRAAPGVKYYQGLSTACSMFKSYFFGHCLRSALSNTNCSMFIVYFSAYTTGVGEYDVVVRIVLIMLGFVSSNPDSMVVLILMCNELVQPDDQLLGRRVTNWYNPTTYCWGVV